MSMTRTALKCFSFTYFAEPRLLKFRKKSFGSNKRVVITKKKLQVKIEIVIYSQTDCDQACQNFMCLTLMPQCENKSYLFSVCKL